MGQEFATLLQSRKYDWLLDAVRMRDEDFNESNKPVLRSELDPAAYELVAWAYFCIHAVSAF